MTRKDMLFNRLLFMSKKHNYYYALKLNIAHATGNISLARPTRASQTTSSIQAFFHLVIDSI